jgi:hypothetical protein
MGVSEGIAGSDAIPCETNLDPRDPAYRCGEPAELVILEGTLGPVQTWMCLECQIFVPGAWVFSRTVSGCYENSKLLTQKGLHRR